MSRKMILSCVNCHHRNYTITKNRLTSSNRFETKKFCKHCNKHTLHRETK